MVSDRFSKPFD